MVRSSGGGNERTMFALPRLGAVSLMFACACAPFHAAQARQPPVREQSLPADVRAFIERRDACDHFRGEVLSDPSQAREVRRELDYYCTGIDAELARLKRVHARHHDMRKVLDAYDPHVEPAR
jgi:hypothetical protein